MRPLRQKKKLEKDHYLELKRMMEDKGWMVKKVTGSAYMVGWPDCFASHPRYGQRWIETKRPEKGRLSAAQCRVFAEWQKFGVGIWILTTKDDYHLLFGTPNWWKWTVNEFKS